jgi:hypothetical protein
MKKLIKRVLESMAPEWTTALLSAKARAHSLWVVREWGCGPDRERELAFQEVCPDQIWLLCLPNSGPNAGLAAA